MPSKEIQPEPKLHIGDYAAWYKHATGEWLLDAANGEFMSRNTGKPVKFRKEKDGYLRVTTKVKGHEVKIYKHRAIWIAANGILALPLDYSLEVDHINGDRTDCRLLNLRLVTKEENLSSRPGYRQLFTTDEVRTIRKRYAAGGVTQRELAKEYDVTLKTMTRLLCLITYRSVV